MKQDDWQRPLPTSASRIPSLRSRGSYRCTLVNHATNTEVVTESRLERHFYVIAAARTDVASIEEQPPAVVVATKDGGTTKHVFDFRLRRTDGRRVAVDVKPARRVGPSGIEDVQRLVRDQIGSGFADDYVVVTEDDLHPDDVADAELILRARRMPDPVADAAVLAFLPPTGAWTSVADIVSASGLGAKAFNAVVRAIGSGALVVMEDVRIDHAAFVGRNTLSTATTRHQ